MNARSVMTRTVVAAVGIGIALGSAGQAFADSEVSKDGSGKVSTHFRVSGGDTTGEAIILSSDYNSSAGAPVETGPNMVATPQKMAGG